VTTPEAEALARGHYRAQQALTRQAMVAAGSQWEHLDTDDLSGSWVSQVAPRVLAVATAAQLQAAQAAAEYVPAAVLAQEGVPVAAGVVAAEALAGIASDGRDLLSLLTMPIGLMKRLIGDGATVEDASGQALRNLLMLVGTQTADAGRVATGVGIVSDTTCAGYERVVTLPACGRCIVLAGRAYPHSEGFLRHPRCDCQMVPVTDAQWRNERPENTPERLFGQMSPEQQAKAFTGAGAKAIRDGADIGQVVNARRGMATAGGRKFTTEGTTARGLAGRRLGRLAKQAGSKYRRSQIPRVMPEQLYADAEAYGWDREQLLAQLERFGFITT
jgi:hypothetical protein